MTKALDRSYYNNIEERLTKDELLFFENELNKKKSKIEKSLEELSKELSTFSIAEARDEADHAMIATENLTNNRIFVEQQKNLNLIKRSLNKIKLGTYGICCSCEEVINVERLKVKNFTEYCVPCQEEMEKGLI